MHQANCEQHTADHAVGDARLVGDKGSADQQGDHAHQQDARHVVGDLRALSGTDDAALLLSEKKRQDDRRNDRSQLDGKEHARPALVDKEVKEAHIQRGPQHDGGRIPHQRCRPLQIGGHGNGDDDRHRVGVKLAADLQRNGRHHQHGSHVIHKGRNDPRKQRQGHSRRLHVGHMLHDQISQQSGHLAVNKQGYKAHGPGDHQQDVQVDRSGNLVKRQHPGGYEDQRGDKRDVRPVFTEYQQENIRDCKHHNRRQHEFSSVSFCVGIAADVPPLLETEQAPPFPVSRRMAQSICI